MESSGTIGGESDTSACRRGFSVWCATRTITRSGACRPTFPWYGSRGEADRCLLHPTGTGHFTLRSPQRSGAKATVSPASADPPGLVQRVTSAWVPRACAQRNRGDGQPFRAPATAMTVLLLGGF